MTVPLASHRRGFAHGVLAALLLATASPLHARLVPASGQTSRFANQDRSGGREGEKALVLDGSAVLTVGNFQLNVTNWGLLGSRYSFPSSYFDAPSGQWPGGSGHEYLFAAGLWVGGRQFGVPSVSSGQPDSELRPSLEPEAVIYEARNGVVVRPERRSAPSGVPADLPGGDDDGDGALDEDPLDGLDNDGDGLVDEDFAQRGKQMLSCIMRDDDPITRQMYPDHRPLGLEIRQEACAWDVPGFDHIIGLRFVIRNDGPQPIHDLYVGLLVDGDIGRHDDPDGGTDDLAGAFTGAVRQPEGYFEDYAYAWMRDGDRQAALPGWLGVTLDGDGFGDPDALQPQDYSVRALRVLNADFTQGYLGIPDIDSERYGLLADAGRDPDVDPGFTNDYAVLVSVGPWEIMHPGQYVVVDAVLVVAPGAEPLQQAMRTAREVAQGRWYDADGSWSTGYGGRETKVCAEDFGMLWNDPFNPIYRRFADYWDVRCLPYGIVSWPIEMGDLRWDPQTGNHCLYVNADRCEECRRLTGRECTRENGLAATVSCGRVTAATLAACTGMLGREKRVPFVSETALLPPPWLRVVPLDRAVEVYWDDTPERTADPISGGQDFESYRIWRADEWARPAGTSEATGPPVDTWTLRDEFDLVNFWPEDDPDAFPNSFGRNTGLEALGYRPVCLDDPRFAGLAEAMAAVVLGDTAGHWRDRPRLRDTGGIPVPGLEGLLPWEGHPTVLDTFFAVTARPAEVGAPKAATRYYRYHEGGLHNGFVYFYSVTAMDRRDGTGGRILGPGASSLPTGSFAAVVPRADAASRDEVVQGTYEAYAYPNPATRDALERFQAMAPTRDDPTGVRLAFANLPACRSRISIFDLAGDLVQTLEHDGSQGDGQAYWNLTTRNGQEVVSGIYLFVVQPLESGWQDFTGKFVVIR